MIYFARPTAREAGRATAEKPGATLSSGRVASARGLVTRPLLRGLRGGRLVGSRVRLRGVRPRAARLAGAALLALP